MLLYSKWLSEDYMTIAPGFEEFKMAPTLQHALSSMHGPLADYHPNLLVEFFMWGKSLRLVHFFFKNDTLELFSYRTMIECFGQTRQV